MLYIAQAYIRFFRWRDGGCARRSDVVDHEAQGDVTHLSVTFHFWRYLGQVSLESQLGYVLQSLSFRSPLFQSVMIPLRNRPYRDLHGYSISCMRDHLLVGAKWVWSMT